MNNPYFYIFTMAITTYLMRLAPLTLIRKRIKNPFIQSFLYYVPFVTLSILIFPSILTSTNSLVSALGGFIMAVILAYKEKSLLTVALSACIAVYIIELIVI